MAFSWRMPSPQRGGRIADDHLDATILLSAGGGVIVSHGVASALAGGGEPDRTDSLFDEIRFHRVGSEFGKPLVVVFTPHAVRIALDGDVAVRVFVEEGDQLAQIARGSRLQVGSPRREQDISECQYQTSIRGLCLQLIELTL